MMEGKVNNKFSNLPAGWEVKKLKDVAINCGDYGANAPALPYKTGDVRYIRITDIDDYGHLISEDKASLDETIAQNYLLKDNDILFARTGDTVGKSLLYKSSMGRAAYAGYLIRFTLDEKLILPEYFDAIAKSDIFEAFKISMKRIGAKPNINSREYGIFRFPMPLNLDEQKGIAKFFTKVDKAIASVQNSIAAAERLKKGLMQNLLTGKMKPDGTFRTPDEFYIDEKFGKVPVGWHWGRLSEIADIIAGQSPQGEYYNVNGMGKPMLNGPTEFTDKYPVPVQWTTKITKLCKKGDILFTVRGSSTGRMNLADQEYCIGRGLAAIRPKSNNNISFIYYTLLKISEMILAEAKGAGTTFPNVSRGELMKKVILIPDTHQNEIIAPIEQLASFSNSKQRSIDKLEILKKSLMQNLLTGRIKIL